MPINRELNTKEDFERFAKEKHEGFLALKNHLKELKEIEKKTPPKKKSYLDCFLKKNACSDQKLCKSVSTEKIKAINNAEITISWILF